MEYLFYILAGIGITGGLVIVSISYVLSHYSELKIMISDILRAIGRLGKWVRKTSVSSEIEGTLNGVIDNFNENFETSILPNCKIEWVTSENQKNLLQENRAIICLSFDKRDHDLNFYNATYNFIQTALVSKTKPFIKKTISKGIDLLSTKIILKQYRREALSTFNNKFNELDNDTKQIFHSLEETEQSGLYRTFLLPEFYHLGEILNEMTPSPLIETEIDKFVNWLHDLATRDFDERSILRFPSTHLNVGVILVAKLSTYENYGTDPYIARAEKYASDNYNAIYILSKGQKRNKIVKEIVNLLTRNEGFDQVNKKIEYIKPDINGMPVLITCVSLRPNPTTIRYNAWESIRRKYNENKTVNGIIDLVTNDKIIVNIFGLKVNVNKENLSSKSIPDVTKLFREEQELDLKITQFDYENETLEISNIGTKTDPIILIESNLSIDKPLSAKITRIQKGQDDVEKGLIVSCENPNLNVFIPRSKATFSRFTDISKKYAVGQEINIHLLGFDYRFGNYLGEIQGLQNPWQTDLLTKLEVGNTIDATVKDIQERFIICEIIEGLECKLLRQEISWEESLCDINNYNIEEKLKFKVIFIDKEKKYINISLRQLTIGPVESFFDKNNEKTIEGNITSIDDSKGIYFYIEALAKNCFVHWSELVWGNVYPLNDNFTIGDKIFVRAISYKKDYDSIIFSCKRILTHQYTEFIDVFDNNDHVEGKITNIFKSTATVEINYKGFIVQAYIHKSKISNCSYILDSDISSYLPIESTFTFILENKNDKFCNIELTRKLYLKKVRDVKIGDNYKVFYTKSYINRCFFYSNNLEGFFKVNGNEHFIIGQELEVYPISTSSDEFGI